MTHYKLKTSGDIKEYYYKVNIATSEKRGRCVIFKYKGTDPAGSLTAKSSLSDLYRDTNILIQIQLYHLLRLLYL